MMRIVIIALLLIANAAPASAGMCRNFQCGKLHISACAIHEWNGGGYEVSLHGLQKPVIQMRNFKFRFDVEGAAFLNGKRCDKIPESTLD
jgi:hypothetical protein